MYKHTVVYPYNDCFSMAKQNKQLIRATAWMYLKNITVNERSQTQRECLL